MLDTSTETLSRKSPAPSQRIEHRAVILAGQRRLDESDAVFGGDFAAARLGGDDRDMRRVDVDMAQQQRQHALADAAKADDDEATAKGRVLLVEHVGHTMVGRSHP